MHAVFPHTTDPAASARGGHAHLFAQQLIDQLADDLITLNAEGDATRTRLLERGWEPSYLDANLAEAQRRANMRFLRAVDAEPVRSLAEIETDMAEILSSLLPPTQLIVSELQARGISTQHIDLLLPKARARAALGFAHGRSGETH